MLVVGERESVNRTVAIRSRDDGDLGTMALSEVVQKMVSEYDVDF